MQAFIIALLAKVVEVLAKLLLIPQIQKWKEDKELEKRNKELEEANRKLGENYENAPANTASDDFAKLP